MPAFAQRVREDELMDQPGLDPHSHQQALSGLKRVNWWSRTATVVWNELQGVARRRGLDQLRVLDLACGGGDVSIALAKHARQSHVALTLCGWDKSATAVQFASTHAKRCGLDNLRFLERDVLRDPVEDEFDVIICTLFLHHLETPAAQDLLAKMHADTRHAVIVDDLRRTTFGYALACVGTRILSRSSIVHVDGPLSVRAAFTCHEIQQLAEAAGLHGATIRAHWPQRYCLVWERS